jgi:GTPase Era involved in 16S rRNA processing
MTEAATMPGALAIAVVGHTNAGKTSLLRTLTRKRHFGEVSDRPGTTRHVERTELRVDGQVALRFFDTPGLEDSVALWDYLQHAVSGADRPDRVRAFLQGPEARSSFEQEAKVLRTLLDADAAFYVIDTREAVLPKHRAEIEILNSCARPIMPVLNFVRDAASRAAEWQPLLAAAGLHALVRFDAVAPFVGSQEHLYQDLATLLPARRAQLQQIGRHLAQEAAQRRTAMARAIALVLLRLAALRRGMAETVHAQPDARQRAEQDFQRIALVLVRGGADSLLQIQGFDENDVRLLQLPWQDGRWDSDLFHPEALREAGRKLGMGAAVGASVGVVADLAVGGLSLGAGAALGGALGSLVSQGWRQIGGKLLNQLSGVRELTLDNAFLFLVALQLVGLARALDQRGHAALAQLEQGWAADDSLQAPLQRLVHTVQPARSRPDWEQAGSASTRRARVLDAATVLVEPLLAPPDAGTMPSTATTTG